MAGVTPAREDGVHFGLRSLSMSCARRPSLKSGASEVCRETRYSCASASSSEPSRRARRLGSLEEALAQEYRVSRHTSLAPDFSEGLRAQLIDKDRSPKWTPSSLAGVTPAMVEACFAPVPGGDLELPEAGRAAAGPVAAGRGQQQPDRI